MSLDMLKIVCAVEEESRAYILLANQKADDAAQHAREKGEASIESTLAQANDEVTHLLRASDQKAMESAKELASSTANKLATQRARAERRLEQAVEYIVERIVNN
ncbi:MAG: hypothetical protein FWC75_09315 [Oscillospiraceae bacterium]|nr:hypothetical protein [Oscillospiraceae bacterium]